MLIESWSRIRGLKLGGLWIGGVRINNTFVWASHDNGYIPMSWFHWRSGEPTWNEQETCVLIKDARAEWYDAGCSTNLPFICNK
ncbi:hypothetical protein DPMN_108172 [Dreissena polymorpha]|uniref:C-type lectin domain-containing protein n=1 Tax=Dreissena polymorpha TaxID=45954 RepID=A0A9D4QKX2_DREPO|nr:hypothetical protein DPMN_108172 [Dreissena polymorpha]